ncbi:MAG: GntR family transcriptional regulator [Lachnospiraceae bacterium]|nr:GntR family transcriptional regulator [Lachnospiraceae bacterium]MDD3616139.1 GntR family transcriptional regulator [Lachnospiraceae bacterium]
MEEHQDQSLRGQVFNKIRSDILSGRYAQGEELKEATLGEEIGVSRTPVREALRQLELEGLVEIVPNKGAHVTGISHEDVRDIYQMRSYLEGLAARWAAERISDEDINEMEEVILLAEFSLKKASKQDQMVRFDNEFHQIMYRAAGSRMMEHVLRDFHRYVQLARITSMKDLDRATKSVEEHKAILEAIKNRDGDLAEKLANEHILHVIENLALEDSSK